MRAIYFILPFFFMACSLAAKDELPVSLSTMTNELAKGKAQLFDVREQGEWDEGHLSSARLVPLSGLYEGRLPAFATNKALKTYLHCRSGNRVKAAAPLLRGLGFTNVVILPEGYGRLVDYGLR